MSSQCQQQLCRLAFGLAGRVEGTSHLLGSLWRSVPSVASASCQHQQTAGMAVAARQAAAPPSPSAAAVVAAGLPQQAPLSHPGHIQWVFLGPPGVGKGTYASRAAKAFGVPHIATGDLVRAEIRKGTELGMQAEEIVASGRLLPDDLIFHLLERRLRHGAEQQGERGFILDGFPRTRQQAEELSRLVDVRLAFNLALREEVLVEKCMGRRHCTHCGKGYNVADIHLPASGGRPEIVMPPLSPPPECAPHLEIRADDTEAVVRARLQVYRQQAAPVEAYYRAAGTLLDFEIVAGIPETLPGLMAALQPHADKARAEAAAAAAGQQ